MNVIYRLRLLAATVVEHSANVAWEMSTRVVDWIDPTGY